jgi:chromatin remodeling complex protein RSC6
MVLVEEETLENGWEKPIQVTPDMITFLIKNEFPTDNITRSSLCSYICSYIKSKNLQLQENKRQWKLDNELTTLFSESKDKTFSFMNIKGLVSRVIVKA